MGRGTGFARCAGCLSKMRQIDQLKEKVEQQRREIARLQKKLNAVPRTINETPFGSSTPSAKRPVKSGSAEQNRAKKGGARPGHPGHGRKVPANPDVIKHVPAPDFCPDCGAPMAHHHTRKRHVQDIIPQRTINKLFLVQTSRCTACSKTIQAKVPGVQPRAKYSNTFLATLAVQHYLGGRTQGDLCKEAGIGSGALNRAMHDLAGRLEPCIPRLTELFLQDPVRFSDETTWREDGANRYAWLLATLDVSLFMVGRSRAADVPMELFKEVIRKKSMAQGVLVVDRYAAYGCLPVDLQYCYAHLLRDVCDLQKEFPDEPEVACFCGTLGPLLAEAMALRREKISDSDYYPAAEALRLRIVQSCAVEARHPGVQAMQDIFRRNRQRLFHWVRDRRIPADNNYSERSLRPLVIARKLSFGSQSPRGAKTRSTMMSVLHSLAKQGRDPAVRLAEALDKLAIHPPTDIAALLFSHNPKPPPLRRQEDHVA